MTVNILERVSSISRSLKRAGLGASAAGLAAVFCWSCGEPPQRLPANSAPASAPAASAPSMPPAAPAASAQATNVAGDLTYKTPSAWIKEQPTSSMRVAQFRLPKAVGDAEDASLVLFYFGQGQGGSIEANLDRWVGQMQQPDGGSSRDKARTSRIKVNGLNVTLLDLTGVYTAEMSPGSGDRQNKPNSRMRAAVVETPKGPYFFKLVGTEKTVARHEQDFMAFVNSVEFK